MEVHTLGGGCIKNFHHWLWYQYLCFLDIFHDLYVYADGVGDWMKFNNMLLSITCVCNKTHKEIIQHF